MESPPNLSRAQRARVSATMASACNSSGRDYTNIGALIGGADGLTRREIDRFQRAAQRGDGLQVAAHADLFSIGNAAFDSSGVVASASEPAKALRLAVADFIVHGRAWSRGSGNAGADLNRFHRLQRHDGGGQQSIQAFVPLRVSAQAGRDTVGPPPQRLHPANRRF